MSLAGALRTRIARSGPLSIADFMTECLLHPKWGYYTTRDPLGQAGDFITAPEISQMFGELIGLCLAQAWQQDGAPDPFLLVELGPGRGTLMQDMLRATAPVAGFRDAARVHLIEASPALRARQKAALPDVRVTWQDRLADLPDGPIYLVANEFFDALPIRQFVRDGALWRERVVGLTDGALRFGLSDPAPVADLAHRLEDTKDGDLVELCASAQGISAQISARIASAGGAALIVDYSDWGAQGDTFQAVKDHQPADPLAHPGAADLTAHVDFEMLARAAAQAGAQATRVTPQGVFLERLGITARAQALAQGLSGPALDQHVAAHRRLTHPSEMGTLFKVMGIGRKGAAPLAGLER